MTRTTLLITAICLAFSGIGCGSEMAGGISTDRLRKSDTPIQIVTPPNSLSANAPVASPSNPCTEAAESIMGLYPLISRCDRDSDCVFVDSSFSAWTPAPGAYLVEDDCSCVKPLIAANGFELVSQQRALIAALNFARRICNKEFMRENCNEGSGFYTASSHPFCSQGFCRATHDPDMRK